MTDPKILARIKKCLSLANSANEHEAAAALAKAKEMMDAYDISDDDLRFAEISVDRTRRATSAERPPHWEVALIHLVAGVFAVAPVICGKDVDFVGLGARRERIWILSRWF